MRAVAEILTLAIGVVIWYLLKPYIGLGGLLVGAVVAYVLRPIVYSLLGASASKVASDSKSKDGSKGG